MNPILRRYGARKLYLIMLMFILISNLMILFYDELKYSISIVTFTELDFMVQILQNSSSFITFTFILGFLILLVLKMETNIWETILYSVGLSVVNLMFVGLFINEVYPKLGIENPLSLMPILITLNIFMLIFWIMGFIRSRMVKGERKKRKFFFDKRLTPLTIGIISLPFLSINGVYLMNNTGNNVFLLLLLILIPIFVIILTHYHKKIPNNLFPLAIWMFSLSLLFMFSLRTEHIIGWDVYGEYYVFQLTKDNHYWSMSNYFNAYNSCLSITILPTIYSKLLNIADEYIYKLFYQLIYSLIPVSLYKLYKNFVGSRIVLLACFFFISQAIFIAIIENIRTGMALFFYSLFFTLIFSKDLDKLNTRLLFFLFGIGIVFSHYASAYIYFILILSSSILLILHKKIVEKESKVLLPLSLISIIIITGIAWSIFFTKSPAEAFINVIFRSIVSLSEFFSFEFRSKESLNVVRIGLEQKLPSYISYTKFVVSAIIRISIIIGFLYIVFEKKRNNFNPHFLALSSSSFILFGMFILLPFISTGYSLDRILLKLLIFLSVLPVIGSRILFRRAKIGNIFVLSIFLFYFLFQTGFIDHSYGIKTIQLDNSGDSFERFTVSDKEIMSSKFLSNLDLKVTPIFADRYTSLRLWGFGMIPYPGSLQYHYTYILTSKSHINNGYVYLGYYNVKMKKIKEWREREKKVVDENMENITKMLYLFDKIYENGGSQIWSR